MTLYRCFAWNDRAKHHDPDGALWFPRVFQGEGRHDNPDLYGCLYLAAQPLSCVVEQFAQFRGQRLLPSMLRRRGLPLAIAELELASDAQCLDLDDPAVLRRERLRPSSVATRRRTPTQAQARALHERRHEAAGLRWWSIHESSWINITVFDRAAALLRAQSVTPMQLGDPVVLEAAEVLGLQTDA